jgi:hypothetical protein
MVPLVHALYSLDQVFGSNIKLGCKKACVNYKSKVLYDMALGRINFYIKLGNLAILQYIFSQMMH